MHVYIGVQQRHKKTERSRSGDVGCFCFLRFFFFLALTGSLCTRPVVRRLPKWQSRVSCLSPDRDDFRVARLAFTLSVFCISYVCATGGWVQC